MPTTLAARPSRPTTGRHPHPAPRPTRPDPLVEASRSGERLGDAYNHDPYALAAGLGIKTAVIESWEVKYARGRPLARGEQVAAFLSDVDSRTPTVFLVLGEEFGPVGYPLAWAIGAWLYAGTATFGDDDALSMFAMTFLGLRRP